MRILIAEEDDVLAGSLLRTLRQRGHSVERVRTGADADAKLSAQTFGLVVLDLGLSAMSGLEVLRRLRERKLHTPVLTLGADKAVDGGVKALDAGADDYMPKPLALREFEARVRALGRRGCGGGPTVLNLCGLCYDQVNRVASVRGEVVDLSGRELSLLEALLRRMGHRVSKEQLVNHMCEWGEEVSGNAIEVYMHRLRKKIAHSGVTIKTTRGVGYCIERTASELP
ncbi:response regulator transcription factor [Paraburkholderia azotifigens]|uniref:response regulator transcription factor n=1 Tax=Paraburkholderia azotifigens TaxID=2057004 RepID=UPI003173B826